jgi:hypothetical protein
VSAETCRAEAIASSTRSDGSRRPRSICVDLREVRIGDAGEVGELAHRQLAQLALAADDLAEALGSWSVGHRCFILMAHRA